MTSSTPPVASANWTRRKFLGASLAAAGALAVGSTGRRTPPTYAQSSPTATTLTHVLEAAPTFDTGVSPGFLLEVAQRQNRTPEQLADTIAPLAGEPARAYVQILDAQFPYVTPFGQQSLENRVAALQWVVGQRPDLPDLGPRRNDTPDARWRAAAESSLRNAASLAAELNLPADHQPDNPASGAARSLSADDARALRES